jgi:hypothetical protein
MANRSDPKRLRLWLGTELLKTGCIPERKTSGLRNSRVTARRSSRGRSKVWRNAITTNSWAGVSGV